MTALLGDAEQHPEVCDALQVIAFCCASAARSLDPDVSKRVKETASALVRRRDASPNREP